MAHKLIGVGLIVAALSLLVVICLYFNNHVDNFRVIPQCKNIISRPDRPDILNRRDREHASWPTWPKSKYFYRPQHGCHSRTNSHKCHHFFGYDKTDKKFYPCKAPLKDRKTGKREGRCQLWKKTECLAPELEIPESLKPESLKPETVTKTVTVYTKRKEPRKIVDTKTVKTGVSIGKMEGPVAPVCGKDKYGRVANSKVVAACNKCFLKRGYQCSSDGSKMCKISSGRKACGDWNDALHGKMADVCNKKYRDECVKCSKGPTYTINGRNYFKECLDKIKV
tara:strand:+ start:7776 stop:8618 length:843 start_codon:yes stop_codon:yes gene_type:complete